MARAFVYSITLDGGLVTGLSLGTILSTDLPNSGVTAATYTLATVTVDAFGRVTSAANGSAVTSVALAAPAIFTVTGSPVTTTGTLTLTLATQAANLVWAGPTTGAAAAPTFRAMVAADLPAAVAYTDVNNTFTADQMFSGVLNCTSILASSGANFGDSLTTIADLNAAAIREVSSGNLNFTLGADRVTAEKPMVLAQSDDAGAPNGSIYYSTDAGKLVYKDGGGVVNNLY